MFSNVVHEGTHALDRAEDFAKGVGRSVRALEKRGYFYERQYQRWTGGNVRFSTVEEMLEHVNAVTAP